jgi:hypothetical protein
VHDPAIPVVAHLQSLIFRLVVIAFADKALGLRHDL